ncbi:MAG TPA: DegV family protein [Xanthomonadales bacterium]|nr:DegV family protein [Xanthomonadales bacterium]
MPNRIPNREKKKAAQRDSAIAYLDGPRLLRALTAGITHLFQRREYLNRINVFPVPDGDTGTNMAFTFKAILDAVGGHRFEDVDDVLARIAEAALDGARGNSGAIMAQYFQGIRESAQGCKLLTAESLARASTNGSQSAWKAMSEPVPGTLPTVLEDFSVELQRQVQQGQTDIHVVLENGLKAAQRSLANTPEQLPALKAAGVVDAGGQGFVDLLEGIWAFVTEGHVDEMPESLNDDNAARAEVFEVGQHRFCTECVIEGQELDREAVMASLESMDVSSLVVAGSRNRLRIHVHTDSPGEIFLAAGNYGEIRQQKADDMSRQHGLLNHQGTAAVVTDSGADIPIEEIDRLGIHMVPVRLSFGDQEFLDGVSIDPETFQKMLAEATEAPLTSQPPVGDFARQYSLLTSHGYSVVSIGLSKALSGTTGAAIQAASQFKDGNVHVIDSLNATCGQGLLAMAAAEAAGRGYSSDEIVAMIQELIPRTRVFAVALDLGYAVRGGRVPAWAKRITGWLRVLPVLTASKKGEMSPGGVIFGRRSPAESLGKVAAGKMDPQTMYRVMLAHMGNRSGAEAMRSTILRQHDRIHSCHICDAGAALGVHLGPGGLIVAFMPDPAILN